VSEIVHLPNRASHLLTKKQLAAHLGRSTRWIELRVRQGMPSEPPTRRYPSRRFRLAEVEAWLAAGEKKRSPEADRLVRLEQRMATLAARVEGLERRAG
jgi:hypothetical protein